MPASRSRRHFLQLVGSSLLVGCGAGVSRENEAAGGAPSAAGSAAPTNGEGTLPMGGDAGSIADQGARDAQAPTTANDAAAAASAAPPPVTPNLLVIMCDQLRPPMWFPDGVESLLPNMTALKSKSVSFGQHFTAAIQCSPSRASLLTGLYGRQHFVGKNLPDGALVQLDPRFPTWATLLAKLALGYESYWFGKWHLSTVSAGGWAQYGFSAGLAADVGVGDVAPGGDADTAAAFTSWLAARKPGTPWCTTVSLVNPHDIAQTYGTAGMPALLTPPSIATSLPPNYESSAAIQANKPRLQTFFQTTFNAVNALPTGAATDPSTIATWVKVMNLYIQYQRDVDAWIGNVLSALARSPHAASTIVVFTADHGEHGGSHGMWNKHGTAYDETLRVPLYVHDPTGYWTQAPESERQQLTSSVDVAPLLLTLASGGGAWRKNTGFEHLARRADLSAALRDPQAPAERSYILHTSDSIGPGMAQLADGSLAPNHVTALRTTTGKLVVYDAWKSGTATRDPTQLVETEVYDYSTDEGVRELANLGKTSPDAAVCVALQSLLADEGLAELNEAFVDPALGAAQATALQQYCSSPFAA
jgi:arylsulfatase A-like enzyme